MIPVERSIQYASDYCDILWYDVASFLCSFMSTSFMLEILRFENGRFDLVASSD